MPSTSSHDSTVSSYLQRGHYRNSARCKTDIMNALQYYPGLKPKLEKFTFNDGRSRDLICLTGTIPVPYRGSMYNIPVALWILDTHPTHAPLCYVTPTPEMQIRVSQHVDGNGKIYLPYLHEWDSGNSDVLGLIQMCIITFGEQPPVFARPVGQPAQVQPPPAAGPAQPVYPPNPYQGAPNPPVYPPGPPGGVGYPSPASGAAYPLPAYPPAAGGPGVSGGYPPPYPPPGTTSAPSSTPGGSSDTNTITQDHLIMSMRSAVEDLVRRKLREDYAMKNVELQSLAKIKADLTVGHSKLEQALSQLDKESDSLDEAIKDLKVEQQSINSAIERAKEVGGEDGEGQVNPDDAIDTTAPLYRQLLQAHAEEAAIHEAIYYLGEALKQDIIDCDVFLKQVRKLARKQFVLKATMNKCRQTAGLPV